MRDSSVQNLNGFANIADNQEMEWGAEYVGAFLLVVGGLFALWRKKRIFDRTNQFGVERFSSFWGQLGTKTKDGLLGGASIVLLSSGLLILAFRYQDSWGWALLLPIFAFLLYIMFLT